MRMTGRIKYSGPLIGLEARVLGSPNKTQLGLEGRIIDETRATVVLRTRTGRQLRLLKAGLILLLAGRKKVTGQEIAGRPEERIKG